MDVVEGERGGQEQQAASEQLIPSKPAQVADSEVHVASASTYSLLPLGTSFGKQLWEVAVLYYWLTRK